MKTRILPALFCIVVLFASNSVARAQYDGKHEWRAVWIATVNNIDWPSKPGLTSQKQQKELIAYLDLFKRLNFNAIVLQVRPAADALYFSENESWFIYLTGDQAKTPKPEYDPLAFAIEEAHNWTGSLTRASL
ncbi:MAG: family 10 glycosylhydrolase [Rikenellaceae bacterium]